LETEDEQNSDVKHEKRQVEVAIVENLFRQKPPVYRPLEQELTTKFK